MVEIDERLAAEYAVEHGLFPRGARLDAGLLAGGVSNVVLRITDRASGRSLVLKQVREQLRTAVEWHSRVDRIWREVAALRVLQSFVAPGSVPEVLFEDRENFVFAMTAVAPDHTVWKHDLLGGVLHSDIFSQAGAFLGRAHARTWGGEHVPELLRDQQVFDELRLDPYYRWVARRHPELRDELDDLVASTSAAAECLTLADFSPKNILVSDGRIVVVDFETAHLGDPGFDIGFFLTHLVLKTIHRALTPDDLRGGVREFLAAYGREFEDVAIPRRIEGRGMRHLAACLLARVDGKSPVDYLTQEEQAFVRQTMMPLVKTPAAGWSEFESRLLLALAGRAG